MVLYNVTI